MKIELLYQYFKECGVVTTDTRNCPPQSMFFALKGASFNGNAFAAQALQQGCRYAVIDEAEYAQDGDARYIVVDDVLTTLQQLANFHRRQLNITVIGITGTNGKTTTKELMATVLARRFNVLFTQGNLNNHIGVPLTLLRLTSEHEMAVIEMGANHPGEIKTLVEIAEPDYGIITNVGKAHLEGFGSFEGVIRTKGEMYDFLRAHGKHTIFIQNENPHLNAIAHDLQCVRYGTEPGLFVSGTLVGCAPYLAFTWTEGKADYQVTTRLIGSYNLDNLLAAAAVGIFFGVPASEINLALSQYTPQNNRSQLQPTEHNQLIVDAYNANPTSMQAALTNFRLMEVEHKMAILGDMKELGATSHDEHQKVIEQLSDCRFERVILVGHEFAACQHSFEQYPDVAAVAEVLKKEQPTGYYILIKGSNSMKLVQLVDLL